MLNPGALYCHRSHVLRLVEVQFLELGQAPVAGIAMSAGIGTDREKRASFDREDGASPQGGVAGIVLSSSSLVPF